jgi:hypothetical protein
VKGTTASIPLLALVVLALTACGPTPPPGDTPADPRPTPTGSPTPIPVPTPTETLPPEALDPLDTVTRILLLTESVSFCDDEACGVDGFRYDGDAALAIAKLTAVFGTGPESTHYDDGGGIVSDYHEWDGFSLASWAGDGSLPGMGVHVAAANVAGIAIETEHGVHVGTSMSEARDLADIAYQTFGEYSEIFEAHFDVVATDANNWSAVVAFRESDTSGPVTSISAPIRTGDASGPAAGY